MSHTPGPWKVEETWSGLKVYGPNRRSVCLVSDRFSDGRIETCDNACLIAAAPDLLEACRKAWYVLDDIGGHPEMLAIIRAAIAKAEDANP
jgi:hypothetical protein